MVIPAVSFNSIGLQLSPLNDLGIVRPWPQILVIFCQLSEIPASLSFFLNWIQCRAFTSPPKMKDHTPDFSLSELLGKYDVCSVTYLGDVAGTPHVTHLSQITAKHRLVVSLGAHLDLVEDVLNGGALQVAIAGDCASSDFLTQFPKDRLLLEFTIPAGDVHGQENHDFILG